jgi:LL-diaminopimelate aminotransferase
MERPMLQAAEKIRNMPPYILAEVFAARDRKLEEGVDVIDVGVGNPDLRPSEKIIRALHDSLDDAARENHRYPSFSGLPEFKEAIARWYSKRFGVSLDPASEVLPLIGSKEGLAKFMQAYLNIGDTILITSPCYPAYLGAAMVAQAEIYETPLLEETGFLPSLEDIPRDVAGRAKLMLVNYPNNPTGAVATDAFYEHLRQFAADNEIFVMSDIAYCDLSLDESFKARSFLEFDSGKENSIEFHSFSKSYSMQGWRLGFACGNAEAVGNLLKIKTNMDFGVFMAVQRAGIAALEHSETLTSAVADVYRERRDVLVAELRKNGWEVKPPLATMYVWMRIPRSYTSSINFASDLLEKTGVVVAPGIGFGKYGEGFVRVSLTVSKERLVEMTQRMKEAGFNY